MNAQRVEIIPPPKKKNGRPYQYDKIPVCETICDYVSMGKPLAKLLPNVMNDNKGTITGAPTYTQFMRWVGEDANLREIYAQARNASADFYADEIVTIADTEDDPNRARVRIDARKWVCSKLKPKKYGDNLKVDHTGNVNLTSMSDQELMRIVQEQTGGPILIENGSTE